MLIAFPVIRLLPLVPFWAVIIPGSGAYVAILAITLLRQRRGYLALVCLERLSPVALDAAVALLADPGRRLVLSGGRFSRLLATHLGSALRGEACEAVAMQAPGLRARL